MSIENDLRPIHRIVLAATVDVVAAVAGEDLSLPTPCAGWDLAALLAHMTVQHRGFAAAARGAGDDLAIWQPETVTDAVVADPAGAYRAAVADVLDAFAGLDSLERSVVLPELGGAAPASLAIGFHLVDYVVHGWDVAAALGRRYEPSAEVVAATVPLAFEVPDGDYRAAATSPFGPALPVPGQAGDFERILAHLGRDPRWHSA
ncbi:TIGR03086 family metal-binding protein [[Mycobacterium] vasticus]|uniref:TIGR03086 family metal-binding protein n=1 Tax=[Mycobacterium] vasticus TaxID=2875777 RepID=A0ABU5Z4B9_9MYCO|nr:TIGR03086 family metal-binding protein [Mycolicibacter sp. MYC017]MEB3071459.1 TIGR03086 family metal-binding protein [Mycolicibacter sp. MYC017]